MLKKYSLFILAASIIVINALRFINLESIPSGMQIDEQTMGVALGCMAQDGSALTGEEHYPLFDYTSFSNPIPPTYLYPGMLWVKIFGISIGSLRAFTVLGFSLALLGLFALGRHFGGTRCGLWVLLAASISPWTWTFSRIAWESTLTTTFLVWGIFFCLQAKQHWKFILGGILLSGAAYSYPPARLQVPLAMMTLVVYGMTQLRWKISHVVALGAAFGIASIPMVQMYLSSSSLAARFNELSITNPTYLSSIGKTASLPDLALIIWKNFTTYLNLDFLLFKGSVTNLTLSTGRQGILSWLDVLAGIMALAVIVLAIKNKRTLTPMTLWLFGFLFINILIGILPGTLMSIENPHPLRTLGAWPFTVMATGIILYKTIERWSWTELPAALIAIGFAAVFLTQYFRSYPKDSIGMFNIWTVTEARNAKTQQEWMTFLYRYHPHMFTSRYFLMRYHQDSCVQAKTTWETLYPVFSKILEQQRSGQR